MSPFKSLVQSYFEVCSPDVRLRELKTCITSAAAGVRGDSFTLEHQRKECYETLHNPAAKEGLP